VYMGSDIMPGLYTFSFYSPKYVLIGLNTFIEKLGYLLEQMGLPKGAGVAVFIDPAVEGLDHVKMGLRVLSESYSVNVFDKIEYEPTAEACQLSLEFLKESRPESLVAVGGGSTIDTAKISIAAYEAGIDVGEFIKKRSIVKRHRILIAVPTTAGTGSEVSRYAVLTQGDSKVGIAGPHMVPDAALVDPVLTITMPPRITAGSGADALSHAVEAMISTDSNPLSDAMALLAIELISRYLRRAYTNGSDIEARYHMSIAATAAGYSLASARVVLGHSIAQTFGPPYRVHHGTACGITLPYIMEFYMPAVKEKLAMIYDAIVRGEGLGGESAKALSIEEKAVEAVKRVWILLRDLGIPSSLRDIGISYSELERLAERTVREWPRPNSPIELTKDRVLEVYRRMYNGSLNIIKI